MVLRMLNSMKKEREIKKNNDLEMKTGIAEIMSTLE